MSSDWPTPPELLAHDPIEKLSPNLWRVEGALPNMGLRRVMSVAKLADGRLVVHNAIALDESGMQELDAWGEVAFVIVPNRYHRIDAPRYAKRYPKAKIVCPEESRKTVEKKVRVDGGFDALPADPKVRMSMLAGVANREGVMSVVEDSGATLIFNDAVFNMPHLPGVEGWVLKNVTKSTGGPRVTRVARLFVVQEPRAFAEDLVRLADTPNLRRVIVSHHQMITDSPAEQLRAVARSV